MFGAGRRILTRSLARKACDALEQRIHAVHTDSRGYTHFDKGEARQFGRREAYAAGALAAGGAVIYVSNTEPVPISNRSHLVLISHQTEKQLGQDTFKQVLQQFHSQILPPSHPATKRVAKVAKRLITALGDPSLGGARPLRALPHLADCQWEFRVVNSPQCNAFCVPGGKVVVFTGLLNLFPDDNELATVLAHEIAHVVARHAAEKITYSFFTSIINLAAWFAIGVNVTPATMLGMELPFSRGAEREADSIGLQLMSIACYDPTVAPRVFEKLGQAAKGLAPPEWLSTHPSDKKRAAALAVKVPEAVRRYEGAGCGHHHHHGFFGGSLGSALGEESPRLR